MRKQHLKKHSQWFEKPCWRGVPDYSQFVSQPTCLERVDARLSLCARDRARKWRVERREHRRGAARKDGADDEEGEGSLLALGL